MLARIETALAARLPAAEREPEALSQAMRYAILGGGKRLRPQLCFATGAVIGVPIAQLEDAACALEFIHGYSLVHDDLPAMDDDALRRGRPTVHKAFGTATAILVGDALQTLAFAVLANGAGSADVRVAMVRTLAQAAGAPGMIGGQVLDMQAEGNTLTVAELTQLDALKTGCLIRASVLLACDARPGLDAATRQTLDTFAQAIGVAFQIRDDLLDVESDTQTLGKTAGADAAHAKSTWPALLGVDAARAGLDAACAQAMAALASLDLDTQPLRELADTIVRRDS